MGTLNIGITNNRCISMTDSSKQPRPFTFAAGQLLTTLIERLPESGTGYWEHQFDRLSHTKNLPWYLAVDQGKILYSGGNKLSAAGLMKILIRFVPPTDIANSKAHWKVLQGAIEAKQIDINSLIERIYASNLITPEILEQAIRLKILMDFDSYLSFSDGSAKFISTPELRNIPIPSFDVANLLTAAQQRRQAWEKVNQIIYSMKLVPTIKPEGLAKLNDQERTEIATFAGASLTEIAKATGKDNLEVAQTFLKLHRAGIVEFQSSSAETPSILVVDDSPLFLKQFNHWINNIGYYFLPCSDAEKAINTISQAKPSVVFLDVNMPIFSGFELMEKIRANSEWTNLPVVILTGDSKLSNKWRAQWGGCEFLAKPASTSENASFQVVLQELISKLLQPEALTTKVSNQG
jgi:CheY-like chemotaxis protein